MAKAFPAIDLKSRSLGAWFLIVASCWTVLIAVLVFWAYQETYATALKIARSAAGDSFNKDMLYSRWASSHGGIYVPTTAETPPNPYLADIPDRDIVTPSGQKLTLMNPAYMTRQVHELGNQTHGEQGHITSLKSLRPENAPDEWEKKALAAFERGENEVASLEVLGGERYFRLMRPMTVDRGCLKCHANQGYQVGDIRGGISVSLPWTPIQNALNAKIPAMIARYGGIWSIGIFGLWFFRKSLNSHLSNLNRAERTLRKSEDGFKTIFNQSPMGIALIDSLTGRIYVVNSMFAKIAGRTLEETANLDWMSITHPDDVQEDLNNMALLNAGIISGFHMEKRYLRPNGDIVWISMTIAPVKVDNTARPRHLCMIEDITDRKRAEDALQHSERKYRGLFESSHDAIVILESPDWKFASANPATLKMFKAADAEQFGASWPENVSPEIQPDGISSAEKARELIDAALRDGSQNFEWTHQRLDGEPFLCTVSLSKISCGDKKYLQATVRDISESKKAECLLNQTRLNYETFFNRIEDFLFVLDEAGNILHTNSTVFDRLGYSEEDLAGKPVLTVHPPELRNEAGRILVDILTGVTNLCTIPLMAKSGERIPVETRVTSGFWDGKAALYGVCKDVTQVKRSEQMFSRAFHLSSVMMALSRLDDGTFIDANQTLIHATGYSRAELIDGKRSALSLYANAGQRKEIVEKIKSDGSVSEFEVAFRLKDGSIRNCIVSANSILFGQEPCMVSVIVDVTQRKEMERRQNLMAEILEILNAPSVTADAIDHVLAAIQRAMGFDAVGIRLKHGDDFPYFFQKGFSTEFLSTENTLIAYDKDTGFCRDKNGNINRECTCGLVISGQADKTSPFFTAGGSFWTNDLLPLLKLPADQDPRLHPRNRCIREGFRSMAIIPIHANREIVGLLQLNDQRKDGFTADKIQFFEGIGESIGVALVRKQMEDALRESEEKFRTHVDNSFDVIFTIDIEGTFLFASPAWEKHFGYPVSDVIGKRFEEFVHPDDVASCREYLAQVLNAGLNKTSPPYRVRQADGTWLWFEANATRYTDSKNNVQLIGVGREITERKQDEEQLRNYAAALESSNRALEEYNKLAEAATRAKSEFLANMSHEIRTPMTAILGCADLLINEKGLEKAPPQRRQNIETIKRNGEHLLKLLNDILDLSKMEAGKMQIGSDRCSPFQLIEEVISLMRVRAEEKHLKLEADLDEPLPETIRTDPLRLRQVLINLAGNAIKFTDEGSIRIAARLTEHEGKSRIRFDVTDTGIGMNEEQAANLFRAFSQVDNSAARKFSGTGLGLCICKRLAEAMGGNIEVQSQPGTGSTFSFSIDPGPLEGIRMIQHNQAAEYKPAVASENESKIDLPYRILLAEDGPDNQRLIRIILADAGAGVATVENGKLAVEAALTAREMNEPFDIILMDMQMPIMDGYTATRELRARGYSAPVIALTAHAMTDDRQKCLDAGCDDFVSKPIDWEKLISTIAHWATRAKTNKREDRNIQTTTATNDAEEPLRSIYADKPVIARVLPSFVGCLNDRVHEMNAALAGGEFEELRRFAHQLKGAGGSYGYPSISTAALALETDAREKRAEAAKASLAKLAALCQAAVRGFEIRQNQTPALSTTS